MEYSITLPSHVELTNAGAEWTAMKQRHFSHVNPNHTLFHQPPPANLFTSFLISISFDQVQDVLNVLGLSVEEALRFNKILKSFEDLCLPRFLIIYNRYRFFMCKQNGPEFNGFLQQLLAWSDLCEFGELKDILLKDSIISGISEESVRQHLLGTEQLDFNKTVEICKAGLVKHFATDSTKMLDNEFADAWTDTCNDVMYDNHSASRPLMQDKAIGISLEVIEKETQTDLILGDDQSLMGGEGFEVGQRWEASEKENRSVANGVDDGKPLSANDILLLDSLNSFVSDQTQTNSDVLNVAIDLEKKYSPKADADETLKGEGEIHDDMIQKRSWRNKTNLMEDSMHDVSIDNVSSEFENGDKLEINQGSKNICQQAELHGLTPVQNNKEGSVCKCCPSDFETLAFLKSYSSIHSENHQFNCNKCGLQYADAYTLKKHMRSHSNKEPYKCSDCQKSFKWAASLNRHKKIHSGVRPYKCKQENCNATFFDEASLRRHTNSHTKTRAFKCNSCQSSFPDSWALRVHERVHSGERPYHCSVCDATFTRAHHLKDHEKLHTGEKPFECEFCHAKFIEASKLKSHRRKHTGEKPYLCKVCGKTFTWSAAYRRHVKTHTSEKPYTCQVCGNAFADHTTLVRHERTHSGEKPYSCNQCNATFADSSSLCRHRRIHLAVKEYTCSVCSASFAVKTYLTRHMRTHSGEKPHQCDICNAKFGDASKLNRHKKIHTRLKALNEGHRQKRELRKKQQPELLEQSNNQHQQQQTHNQHLQQLEEQNQQQQYNHQHLRQHEQPLQHQESLEDPQQLQLHVQHDNHHSLQQQQEQELHHIQHLQQQNFPLHIHQQSHLPATTDTEKSSFLLWQDPQEPTAHVAIPTPSILDVTISHSTEEPLLLPLNSSSNFQSTSHDQHTQDVHDMSQYLSSSLLEFDDEDNHHPHHHHDSNDLHPPNLHNAELQNQDHELHPIHPSAAEDDLSRVPDQSFITDIPVHVVTGSVLDDIFNMKSS